MQLHACKVTSEVRHFATALSNKKAESFCWAYSHDHCIGSEIFPCKSQIYLFEFEKKTFSNFIPKSQTPTLDAMT